MIQAAKNKTDAHSRWINELVQRRGKNIAAVALAHKNARVAWALLTKDDDYRLPAVA